MCARHIKSPAVLETMTAQGSQNSLCLDCEGIGRLVEHAGHWLHSLGVHIVASHHRCTRQGECSKCDVYTVSKLGSYYNSHILNTPMLRKLAARTCDSPPAKNLARIVTNQSGHPPPRPAQATMPGPKACFPMLPFVGERPCVRPPTSRKSGQQRMPWMQEGSR